MPPTQPRLQEQRRERTRAKLLAATLDCLVEEGYAGTTLRRVTQRAGVSQGGQSHHFRRRVDLVTAALAHLVDQRLEELHAAARDRPAERRARVRWLLDILWGDLSSPLFAAVVELWVAAAHDAELRERLLPLDLRFARDIEALFRDLAGDLADEPGFEDRLRAAADAMRGAALSKAFEPLTPRHRDRWPERRAVLEQLLVTGT